MKENGLAYETPELAVYGSVESITQSTWKLGTGDAILGDVLVDVLDCDPNKPEFCATTTGS